MKQLVQAALLLSAATTVAACSADAQSSTDPVASQNAASADVGPTPSAHKAATATQAGQSNIEDVGRPIRSDELLERADQSFSAYPLAEETLGLRAQGFTIMLNTCASEGGECSWRDGNGVIHILDGDNILFVKMVEAADFRGRSIEALGIGMARDRAAVVRNVSRYLLGTEITCREAEEAGEGEGISSCGATLGEGWIKLLFTPDNQLLLARVDAYQAN
jgi:hypothetical protein